MLMTLVILGIGWLITRWACQNLPAKRWVTVLLVIFGMLYALPLGFTVGAAFAFLLQNNPNFSPNELFESGLTQGGLLLLAQPFLVWFYRRHKNAEPMASDCRDQGV